MLRLFITFISCFATLSATAAPHLLKIAEGLEHPTFLSAPAKSSDYLYILEQKGCIKLFDRKHDKLIDRPFLDISAQVKSDASEQGLLGLAFSPAFAQNKRFYLNYTNLKGDTVISRFTIQPDHSFKEEQLIQFKQDFGNHNGGWIGFGPNDLLYITTGDGGSANDPNNRAQDPSSLLGKLLRIDVSAQQGYTIPKNNYAEITGKKAKPEILAIGLRNPWRCSWDGSTLYIADVGQNHYEEINAVPLKHLAGANFGWRLREGKHPNPKKTIAGKRPAQHIEPIHAYPHTEGQCIIGGYVYRGKITSIQGHYFYADYSLPSIKSLTHPLGKPIQHHHWNKTLFSKDTFNISSFGLDPQGELYLMSYDGSIYKIVNKNAERKN